MPSKELIASVIEAIVKNPPKVTRFKDMETLEYSEVVDYTPTAQAAISTIRAALQEPTEGMLLAAKGFGDTQAWQEMLNASALGEQSDRAEIISADGAIWDETAPGTRKFKRREQSE